jgi:hypothetical protein
MNILRINLLGNKTGITTTFLLGRIPKREYPSSVKMNISRIDSKGKEYLSSVKMNISRINFLGVVKMNPLGRKRLLFPGIRAEVKYLQIEKNITSYWVIDFQRIKSISLGKI